ncbi:hypothetical protein RDI58_008017 [Solanum bulbocastanum]
MKLQLQ